MFMNYMVTLENEKLEFLVHIGVDLVGELISLQIWADMQALIDAVVNMI